MINCVEDLITLFFEMTRILFADRVFNRRTNADYINKSNNMSLRFNDALEVVLIDLFITFLIISNYCLLKFNRTIEQI